MKENERIGFAVAKMECKCGNIEYYNWYKPLEAPKICSKCGKALIDKAIEKQVKKIIKIMKKKSGGMIKVL